ncbi:hypothetical protein [Micromonospora lupini]|uniref:hypothetical protein n=1 Tax=Micromonospora lupini TaxID=285679 RepID=UPI00192BF080|nr:hypothetical protein [Micromonospora lupini]
MTRGLPAEVGDAVLHAARFAFTDGLHLAAIAAMVAMVLGAVTALVTLRGVRPADPAALAAESTQPSGTPLPEASSVSR